MTIEVLFSEVCNLFGDSQNVTYLRQTLPDAEVIETPLTDKPWFAEHTPQLIYMGPMTEKTQRRVIEALRPYKDRLAALIEEGTVMLFTGNTGEVLMGKISYVTEKLEAEGLGLLPFTVKTDYFDRYNGKVLGKLDDLEIVGFRSQFSMVYGGEDVPPFVQAIRGVGRNKNTKAEGARVKNCFVTSLLGPILPNNPLFTERLLGLMGADAPAAHRDLAMAAYEQRLAEFKDPTTEF